MQSEAPGEWAPVVLTCAIFDLQDCLVQIYLSRKLKPEGCALPTLPCDDIFVNPCSKGLVPVPNVTTT